MPSFVVSHLSVDSFQRNATFVDVPRSISIPALADGVPISPELRVMILSSSKISVVLSVVVVPLTVKFPETIKSLKVTLLSVATA